MQINPADATRPDGPYRPASAGAWGLIALVYVLGTLILLMPLILIVVTAFREGVGAYLENILEPNTLHAIWLTVLVAVSGWLLMAAFAATSVGRHLEKTIVRPVAYGLRHVLGNGPRRDPRLKIFALDDASTNALKDDHLSLAGWQDVVKNVSARHPQVIIVAGASPARLAARFGETCGLSRSTSCERYCDQLQSSDGRNRPRI